MNDVTRDEARLVSYDDQRASIIANYGDPMEEWSFGYGWIGDDEDAFRTVLEVLIADHKKELGLDFPDEDEGEPGHRRWVDPAVLEIEYRDPAPAVQPDERSVSEDDENVMLLGYYNDMPMGGWTDGDEGAFRTFILATVIAAGGDHGDPDIAAIVPECVHVHDLQVRYSFHVTDAAREFATAETCDFVAQALLNAGGTVRKAEALRAAQGADAEPIMAEACEMARAAGRDMICWIHEIPCLRHTPPAA